MDYFNKNKMLIGIIAALLVINVATLATLWWMVANQSGSQRPGLSPKDFIVKELQLTTEQQKLFDQLRQDHKRTSAGILEQLQTAKQKFFALVQTHSGTDSVVTKESEEIGRLHAALDLATLRHFQAIKNICNNDQRAKFDAVMEHVLQMLASPPPPPDGQGKPRVRGPRPGSG